MRLFKAFCGCFLMGFCFLVLAGSTNELWLVPCAIFIFGASAGIALAVPISRKD